MKVHPVTLIVGSDSLVGGALIKHLSRAGERVVGTTRRHQMVDEDHMYLELSDEKELEKWHCPWPADIAVVCAGVTKVNDCRLDPVRSAQVNVQGITALVKNLVAQGAFVVYLSTNQVFDGSVPHRSPDDPLSPVTEYGRQKAEAERLVAQWGKSVAIVRFSKILEPRPALFASWTEALRANKTIHPFSDMVMAPVPLACAVSVLRLVADRRLPGIVQVSGERDISYAEAAHIGARLLGADESLVQPIRASQSGRYQEQVPAHTTLNTGRMKSELGIEPPAVDWTVRTALSNS